MNVYFTYKIIVNFCEILFSTLTAVCKPNNYLNLFFFWKQTHFSQITFIKKTKPYYDLIGIFDLSTNYLPISPFLVNRNSIILALNLSMYVYSPDRIENIHFCSILYEMKQYLNYNICILIKDIIYKSVL